MWQPLGKVQALSVGGGGGVEAALHAQADGHRPRLAGQLHDVDRPVGAGDAERAVLELDVGGGGLEQLRRERLAALDHEVRRRR